MKIVKVVSVSPNFMFSFWPGVAHLVTCRLDLAVRQVPISLPFILAGRASYRFPINEIVIFVLHLIFIGQEYLNE